MPDHPQENQPAAEEPLQATKMDVSPATQQQTRHHHSTTESGDYFIPTPKTYSGEEFKYGYGKQQQIPKYQKNVFTTEFSLYLDPPSLRSSLGMAIVAAPRQ